MMRMRCECDAVRCGAMRCDAVQQRRQYQIHNQIQCRQWRMQQMPRDVWFKTQPSAMPVEHSRQDREKSTPTHKLRRTHSIAQASAQDGSGLHAVEKLTELKRLYPGKQAADYYVALNLTVCN